MYRKPKVIIYVVLLGLFSQACFSVSDNEDLKIQVFDIGGCDVKIDDSFFYRKINESRGVFHEVDGPAFITVVSASDYEKMETEMKSDVRFNFISSTSYAMVEIDYYKYVDPDLMVERVIPIVKGQNRVLEIYGKDLKYAKSIISTCE